MSHQFLTNEKLTEQNEEEKKIEYVDSCVESKLEI